MKPDSSQEILLDDGSRLLLVDMLSAPKSTPSDEVSNNIYRVTADGRVMWQVVARKGMYDQTPFTGLGVGHDNRIVAFRFDGDLFEIDVETGKATFIRFVK